LQNKIKFDTGRGGLIMIFVIGLGIYVWAMFFGVNSLEVLIELNRKHTELSNRIEQLKIENAKYQKEYFELKQLEGEVE
jgi:hypothetical protein